MYKHGLSPHVLHAPPILIILDTRKRILNAEAKEPNEPETEESQQEANSRLTNHTVPKPNDPLYEPSPSSIQPAESRLYISHSVSITLPTMPTFMSPKQSLFFRFFDCNLHRNSNSNKIMKPCNIFSLPQLSLPSYFWFQIFPSSLCSQILNLLYFSRSTVHIVLYGYRQTIFLSFSHILPHLGLQIATKIIIESKSKLATLVEIRAL